MKTPRVEEKSAWSVDCAHFFSKIKREDKHKTHLCIPLRQGVARDWRGVPKFIDEPTSGLDPVARKEVLKILEKLRSEGRAILFSTHITSDLDKIADRVIYIAGGQIQLNEKMAVIRETYDSVEDIF